MAIDALVKPLLSLSLFRGLKPLQLTEIVRRAERIVYRPGDYICEEDRPGDAAIIIVSGTCVRLPDDRQSSLGDVLPVGSMIAELAMLVEISHVSTIIARDSVRALRLTRTQMIDLMHADVSLAEHFSSFILDRLRNLADELAAVDANLAPTMMAVSTSRSATEEHALRLA